MIEIVQRMLMRLKKKVPRFNKTYPKKYDSGFEHKVAEALGKDWDHHPDKIEYVSKHTYEPDFRREVDGKVILIEAKGRFRTRNEAAKYIAVREALKENEELVFVFYDADKPLVGAKKRKDGTKQSHGEWATGNGFRWYCWKQGGYKDE